MKKFFKFRKSKKEAGGSASGSTDSVLSTGYVVKDKDLSKIHKAAWTGDLGKLQQHVKKDVNALDKENRSSLHLACARGHVEIVKELVSWKAKMNVGDNDARTPLIKAVEGGYEECTNLLLAAGANSNTTDRFNNGPMHYACQAGSIALTKILLEVEETNIDLQNNDGLTALHMAVLQRNDDIAKLLLEEGANTNMQDSDGRTALMHTCHDGMVNTTKVLLQYQADKNIKDSKGWTADDIALMANHEECRLELSRPQSAGSHASNDGALDPIDDPDLFGGPAVDQFGYSSGKDELPSKLSDLSPDSWADTDDDQDSVGRQMSIPNLDLHDLSNLQPKGSPMLQKNRPFSKQSVDGSHSNPGGPNGPPSQDVSQWSDDTHISSKKGDALPSPRIKNDPDAEYGMGTPLASSTARSNAEDKDKEKEEIAKAKHKQMLADLGLSDVSDVSDPDFGDDSIPLSSHRSAGKPPTGIKPVVSKASVNTKLSSTSSGSTVNSSPRHSASPKSKPRKQTARSDWDSYSDEYCGTVGQPKGDDADNDESGWDSDVDSKLASGLMSSIPGLGFKPATTPGPKDALTGAEKSQESLSQWDTEPDDTLQASQTKDNFVNAVAKQADRNEPGQNSFVYPPRAEMFNTLESSMATNPPLPAQGLVLAAMRGDDDDNDDADDDGNESEESLSSDSDGISSRLSEVLSGMSGHPPVDVYRPPPVGIVKDAEEGDKSKSASPQEENIESDYSVIVGPIKEEWGSSDKEDKGKKSKSASPRIEKDAEDDQMRTKSKSASPPKEVVAGASDKEDKGKTSKSASPSEGIADGIAGVMEQSFGVESMEEESSWEKEHKEKALERKKSLERERQWEKEYQERQKQHQIDAQKELQAELADEDEEGEYEEEHVYEHVHEHVHEKMDDGEISIPTTSLVKRRGTLEKSSIQYKEKINKKVSKSPIRKSDKHANSEAKEEGDKSLLIRLKREQAEQELQVAKANQKPPPHINYDNHSLANDEEDTFNDIEVPDLEVAVSTDIAYANAGGPGPQSFIFGHSIHDEDALSYSSTEQEVSIHDQLGVSQGVAGSSHLNLSFNSDTLNVVRLQDQVREARRLFEKERSTRTSLENKRKNLENEKSELITKLEDITQAKSQLEQHRIDVAAKMRKLQYDVTEETEKRRNAEVLLSKTKEQLSRKEDQYTAETEAKQKAELSMLNLQMELRSSLNTVKQMEDDKDDMARQLQHEKNSRQLQEKINDEQQSLPEYLRMTEDAAQPCQYYREELAAALNRMEEADENRRAALESVENLRADLYATKLELDRHKNRFKDDHSMLTANNDDLAIKIEDMKYNIKLQEEALAHATMQYNIQLSQFKSENNVLSMSLEKEAAAHEKLDAEVESLRSRLSSTSTELEKSQAARSEVERNSHKEHEEWTRLLNRRDEELNSLKQVNQNFSLRLGAAEAKVSAVEHEFNIANATLIERTNQLSIIQRELDQRRGNQDNMDESFLKDREENVRIATKMESLAERLRTIQHENLTLKQKLEEARLHDMSHEQADKNDKLNVVLADQRAAHDKAFAALEVKNTMLQEQISHLRDDVRTDEAQNAHLDQQYQYAQSELAETTKRLSLAEASLDLSNKAKEESDHERITLKAKIDQFQMRLDDAREKLSEANAKASHLSGRLENADRNSMATSQQLITQSADAHDFARNKSELEVEVHRLELSNAKLEAALSHETDTVRSLQKELNDTSKVRNTMDALLTNLKTSNAHLDEKLIEAAMSQTLANQKADDSQQLWELEVKGRSKLGLRVIQMDRDKQEALGQVEEEKRRTRKAMEIKRSAEYKLKSELQRATQLQKEVATLKAHLKAAKKRLKELDSSDSSINILKNDFNKERQDMERMVTLTRKQLEDVQSQLTSEVEAKEFLESKTRSLTDELKNLTQLEKSQNKLERAKRKLEDEISSYKNHISNNFVERSELERIKAELEAKSRIELNAKLEEVNKYLEEQAVARQRLDTMRDSNEDEMRKDFERTQKELMDELSKFRGSYSERTTNFESKDFEAKKFKELYESEVKLRERLADKLEQANEKVAKAQLFMDRQFAQSMDGTIQNNWMTSTTRSPLLLGKRSLGHGVNDFSHKIRAELNRSISKHMEKSPQIDISLPPRSFDDINVGTSSFNKASTDYLKLLKKNYMLS